MNRCCSHDREFRENEEQSVRRTARKKLHFSINPCASIRQNHIRSFVVQSTQWRKIWFHSRVIFLMFVCVCAALSSAIFHPSLILIFSNFASRNNKWLTSFIYQIIMQRGCASEQRQIAALVLSLSIRNARQILQLADLQWLTYSLTICHRDIRNVHRIYA